MASKVGPRMRELQAIVSAMPGCSKVEALAAADLPTCGMGYTRPMDRAIAAGLIIAVPPAKPKPGRPYRLFASERDRRIFELRAELLSGPDSARAEAIVREVEELRNQQAATWGR